MWSSLIANGSIDFITYLILTVVLAVFVSGIFQGFSGCGDKKQVIPNFIVYTGSIYAFVFSVLGLIFCFLTGVLTAIGSAFSQMSGNSISNTYTPQIDFSSFFKIILFVLLIPLAAYAGVYLGYFIKKNF